MPVVKSRITLPDGTPAVRVRVNLRVLATPKWHSDGTGVTLGRASVWTGQDGWWQVNLLPHTAYEDHEFVYVEVTEFGPAGSRCVSYIRVPNEAGPLLMRSILVNPPPPDGRCWRPVNSLGDLWNVDDDADQPPEGAALVVTGGQWTAGQAGVSRLVALADVDADSVAAAQPGDPLVYLGSAKGWGVQRDTVAGLVFLLSDPGPGVDPGGWTVRLTLKQRQPDVAVTVDWGDLASTDMPPDIQQADHTYPAEPADYFVGAVYADGSGQPGTPEDGNDNPHLPLPREQETSP